MPKITFRPLSRNRYRLNGGGKKLILKGFQLETYRRARSGRKRPPPIKKWQPPARPPASAPEFKSSEAFAVVAIADWRRSFICPRCDSVVVIGVKRGMIKCLKCGRLSLVKS